MKKLSLIAISILLPMMAQAGQSASWPITQENTIPVTIESVDGDSIFLRVVNEVTSRDGTNRVNVGDSVVGTLMPLKPGNTRIAICVHSIRSPEATRLVAYGRAYPKIGCLGQLHDMEGAAGVPLGQVKPGARLHVFLNGDIYID